VSYLCTRFEFGHTLQTGYTITQTQGTTGSLLSLTDHQEHAQRRKVWDRSMNTQAVLGYQDLLFARIGQLVRALEKLEGSKVDLGSWLSYFSYAILPPFYLLRLMFKPDLISWET
jgi:cytochrome P450